MVRYDFDAGIDFDFTLYVILPNNNFNSIYFIFRQTIGEMNWIIIIISHDENFNFDSFHICTYLEPETQSRKVISFIVIIFSWVNSIFIDLMRMRMNLFSIQLLICNYFWYNDQHKLTFEWQQTINHDTILKS